MDTEVTQSPGHLVKGKDQKAKMDCVPIKGHASVYWYLKKLESFEFLVYLRNGKITEDTAMFKQRFSAECPQNSPCSLEINSTEAADSALYFCEEGTGKSGGFAMWKHPRGHVWNVVVSQASS